MRCEFFGILLLIMDTSVLVARREARRRRILENSENRLQKITGRLESHIEEPSPLQNETLSNSSVSKTLEDEILKNGHIRSRQPLHQSADHSEELLQRNFRESHRDVPDFNEFVSETRTDSDEESILLTSRTSLKQECPNPITPWWLSIKIHFILLAVCVRLLYFLDFGYLYGEALFAPALLLQLSHWIFISPPNSLGPSLLGLALIFSGLPQNQISRATKCLGYISAAIQNIALYFVIFVVCHQFIELLLNISVV